MNWGRTSRIESAQARDFGSTLPRSSSIVTSKEAVLTWLRGNLNMSKFKRTIKGLVVAGVCGIGLCALARKLHLSDRLADLAQNVEGVPFPGTRLYTFLTSRQLRTLYHEVAEDIAESDIEGKVLDLCTGLGYLAIELAEVKPSLTVTGVDSSGEMVRIAQINARTERVRRKVDFATGDPTNLPYPGRYFDLVVSVNILNHWDEPREVFEEIHHILNPGGEFWVYDYKKDIPDAVWERLEEHLQAHQRMLLQIGPVRAARNTLGEDEIIRLAEEAHFEAVSAEDRCLTIFHECTPAFTWIRLRKAEVARE